MVIDELEFVSTPLTTRLFSVTVFTILEKLTCSITSTFSEPVNPLAVSSHPMTEIIMLRIKIGIILYILKFNKILFVLPRVLNIHSLWNRITDIGIIYFNRYKLSCINFILIFRKLIYKWKNRFYNRFFISVKRLSFCTD